MGERTTKRKWNVENTQAEVKLHYAEGSNIITASQDPRICITVKKKLQRCSPHPMRDVELFIDPLWTSRDPYEKEKPGIRLQDLNTARRLIASLEHAIQFAETFDTTNLSNGTFLMQEKDYADAEG
jgi:hypothetical protein